VQANLGAIKVLLPNITEWTLDYTNACLWLRTPLAWYPSTLPSSLMPPASMRSCRVWLLTRCGAPRYKLGKPLPDYEPHFKEVNVKFEICNHLTSILEDEDNADIDFDRTISEVGFLLPLLTQLALRCATSVTSPSRACDLILWWGRTIDCR
jgi:hypothetical protein